MTAQGNSYSLTSALSPLLSSSSSMTSAKKTLGKSQTVFFQHGDKPFPTAIVKPYNAFSQWKRLRGNTTNHLQQLAGELTSGEVAPIFDWEKEFLSHTQNIGQKLVRGYLKFSLYATDFPVARFGFWAAVFLAIELTFLRYSFLDLHRLSEARNSFVLTLTSLGSFPSSFTNTFEIVFLLNGSLRMF